MKKIKFASDLAIFDRVRLGGFDYQVLNTECSTEERIRVCLQPIGFDDYIAFIDCHEDAPWVIIEK